MSALWTTAIALPLFFLVWFFVEDVFEVPLSVASFRFKYPWAALLLLAAPLALLSRGLVQVGHAPRLRVSRARDIAQVHGGFRRFLTGSTTGLRINALCLLVFALMRPQSIHARNSAMIQGLDIAITMDMSLSMRAQDIQPNRFLATQYVVDQFVSKRPNDRIGAVIFGAEAFTLLPLTTDKDALRAVIRELELGTIDGEGTAIGNAVGTALNRLRRSTEVQRCIEEIDPNAIPNELTEVDAYEERLDEALGTEEPIGRRGRTCGVVILATDGSSNRGNISPSQAARFAQEMGVKIFTILMGVEDEANFNLGTGSTGRSILGRQRAELNPELLQDMAETTGGQYFAVADRAGLEGSFHEILNQLEQHDIEDRGKTYGELFGAFAWPAGVLLFLELLVGTLVLRRWP